MVDMQKQLPYLHIPLHSTLTENCTRQKTKVGRDKPMWNNRRVKYNLMVITPTLSHVTAFIWLYFELAVCVYEKKVAITALICTLCTYAYENTENVCIMQIWHGDISFLLPTFHFLVYSHITVFTEMSDTQCSASVILSTLCADSNISF